MIEYKLHNLYTWRERLAIPFYEAKGKTEIDMMYITMSTLTLGAKEVSFFQAYIKLGTVVSAISTNIVLQKCTCHNY